MITLPENKVWQQHNRGNASGTLWSSFNLNLTEEDGKTKVSPRMVITTNDITDLGVAVNFKIFSSKIWTVAGAYVFVAPNIRTGTAFAKAALGSDPSTCSSDTSDLELYNSKLFITTQTSLEYTDGATWSTATNGTGLTSGAPHKLLAFRKKNRLYYSDAVSIFSLTGTTLNKTPATTYTYTLNSSQQGLIFTSMLQTDEHLWLLTHNSVGDSGQVIIWNGETADTAYKIIPLDSRGSLAGIVKDGTPYIMTVDGRLQYYNGGTFIDAPYGKLPVADTEYFKNTFSNSNDRWIHPNGMTIINGRINILINTQNDDASTTMNESSPSGMWEYDPNIGWYHRNSLTQYTTTGETIYDYGQSRLSRVGGLVNLKSNNVSSDTYIGTVLAGAQYYTNATTTAEGIWTNDSKDLVQKYGYLVTTKIFSPLVTDNFNRLFIRLKKLLSSNDRIVVKYRTDDIASTEATITWATTTGFNTTTNVSAYVVGDEVEVTQGKGAGKCAHITAITASDTGYLVELDETFPNASGTAKARFQKWTKLTTLSSTSENILSLASIAKAPWIQLKVCFLFTGNNEIYNLLIENKPNIQVAAYSYN